MLEILNKSDLSQIFNSCPMGLAISDNQQKISWVNGAFEDYLGISSGDIRGQSISELPKVLQPLFSSSNAVHIPSNSLRDDQWFVCSQKKLDSNGDTVHFITDVGPVQLLMKEREALKIELRESLAIDEATGMPNKVALFKSLEPQISRSRRYDNLLSIVIMRINHLDQLDEAQIANLMLPISQMLNDQVRWADIVGKLNESDFLLVLPETSADACKNLSGNLGERLADITRPESLPDKFKISARFGYSEWGKGDDLNLFMQKAEKMLEN